MPKISDVSTKALRELLGTRSVGTPVLAINAGSAATLKTTQSPAASFLLVIDGKPSLFANLSAKVVATLAALQTPITGQATYYVQPVSTAVYYLVVTDGTNTYVIQGTYAGQSFTPFSNILGTGDLPDIVVPKTYAPIGCIKVTTDASHTFTPATTAWDAAGLTVVFTDLNMLPSANP